MLLKWPYFILSHGWEIFYCIYVPRVLNHSTVSGDFDSFWVSDVVNSTAVTREVQLFLQNIGFGGDWSKVELALLFIGLWGTSVLIFTAGVPTVLQQCGRELFLPRATQHHFSMVLWMMTTLLMCGKSYLHFHLHCIKKQQFEAWNHAVVFSLLNHRLVIHLLKVHVWQWAWFITPFPMPGSGHLFGQVFFY